MDRPDTAGTFLFSLSDRDTAEDGRFTNLRQSHKRNRAAEIQAASKPGHFGDRIVRSVRDVYMANRAGSGFQNPQLVVVPARRMRHGETVKEDLIRGRIHHDAAILFAFSPAGRFVALTQRGDVTNLAVAQAEPVQVAAIFGSQRGDKRRLPFREKAVLNAANSETRKQSVDEPEFIVHPFHFVSIENSLVRPQCHQFSGLTGCDQQRDIQFFQQCRKRVGVNTAKWLFVCHKICPRRAVGRQPRAEIFDCRLQGCVQSKIGNQKSNS